MVTEELHSQDEDLTKSAAADATSKIDTGTQMEVTEPILQPFDFIGSLQNFNAQQLVNLKKAKE